MGGRPSEYKKLEPPLPFIIKDIEIISGFAGVKYQEKVADGWIISFNAGEAGASVWHFSADGKTKYKLSNDHMLGFYRTTVGVLAIEGFDHGMNAPGRVLRFFQNQNGKWTNEKFIDLAEAPHAAFVESKDLLLIVTRETLLRVNLISKKTDVLIKDAFWYGLYPNSIIVTPKSEIFLGMRHGVAKINKPYSSHDIKWLLPNEKVVNEKFVPGIK